MSVLAIVTKSTLELEANFLLANPVVSVRPVAVPAVDNVKDKLNSLNDKFLGERGLYHGISSLRSKAKEMKENITKLLKSKQIIK